MADIQKLIETVLSDNKLLGSSNFTSRIYRDEPILTTAAQIDNHMPPEYRRMRKIAAQAGIYNDSDAKLFYDQARLMENFEDNFNFHGQFSRYYPTYQAMNDIQLRGYFSWRTSTRRGIVRKTSLSFVFVYIYELLNQIGVKGPEDGYFTLKNFWMTYREIDSRIDSYIKIWLNDYIIYNNLDKSLLEDLPGTSFDQSAMVLLRYKSHDIDGIFSALNGISSYKLEDSRFFKNHSRDVKNVVYNVFSNLSERYDNNVKSDNFDKFFGRIYSNPYTMFSSAVFYRQKQFGDFVYEINDIYRYRCRNGNWSCERFFCYGNKKQHIGALLKAIDFFMRLKYNFKSTLKEGEISKKTQNVIQSEIEKYLKSEEKSAISTVKIDISQLQGIREAALEIQNKLTVDEPENTNPPEVLQIPQENATMLSAVEYRFMQCLLYGKSWAGLVRSEGLMISVLIDGINGRLFDLFGDTVLVDNNGKPEPVSDYTADLKRIIKE